MFFIYFSIFLDGGSWNKIHVFLGVCALRLDFEAFTTLGPATTTEVDGGICVDSFVASAVCIETCFNF